LTVMQRLLRKLNPRKFRYRIFKPDVRESDFDNGWYHPMPFRVGDEIRDSHILFGVRSNYPFKYSNILPELWGEFVEEYRIQLGLSNSTKVFDKKIVWDIGPAEGLFSYLAICQGAVSVELVQPKNILGDRLLTFFAGINLLEKVVMNFGYFPSVIPKQSPDLIICSGVLYHADDVQLFLDEILRHRVPVLIETTIDINENNEFIPTIHNDGFSSNTSLHLSWLKIEIEKNKFKIFELPKYNLYCEDRGNFVQNFDRHGTSTIHRWAALLLPPDLKD
jgi:hypothetical protein